MSSKEVQSHQRRRAFSSKSRTGCYTCKARRIKCDENRPTCNRCIAAGRKCEGFPIIRTTSSQDTTIVHARVAQLLPKPIEPGPPRREDAFLLQDFSLRIGTELFGFSDLNFWTITVPQLAQAESCILDAVRAVSLTYQIVEQHGGKIVSDIGPIALASYNKAVRSIVISDGIVRSSHRPRTLLIVCVLLVIVEFLKGDPAKTSKHIQDGGTLLSQWRTRGSHSKKLNRNISLTSSEDQVMDELQKVFCRLHTQNGVFGANSTRTGSDLFDLLAGSMHSPQVMTQFEELADTANVLLHRSMKFVSQSYQMKFTSPVSVDQITEQQAVIMQCKEWQQTCDNFWQSKQYGVVDQKMVHATLTLRTHIMCAAIWTAICLSVNECIADSHKEQFEAIMRICQVLQKQPSDPAITVNTGMIPILHFIGTRCRWPEIRRQVLDLLSCRYWREGLFDSRRSYNHIKAMMQLEEDATMAMLGIEYEDLTFVLPPREARIIFGESSRWTPGSVVQRATFLSKPNGLKGAWRVHRVEIPLIEGDALRPVMVQYGKPRYTTTDVTSLDSLSLRDWLGMCAKAIRTTQA